MRVLLHEVEVEAVAPHPPADIVEEQLSCRAVESPGSADDHEPMQGAGEHEPTRGAVEQCPNRLDRALSSKASDPAESDSESPLRVAGRGLHRLAADPAVMREERAVQERHGPASGGVDMDLVDATADAELGLRPCVRRCHHRHDHDR